MITINDFLKKNIDNCAACLSDKYFAASVINAAKCISQIVNKNLPVLICGNGGSASDSEHFATELVGRFLLKNRPGLSALSLTTSAVMTALGNDFGYEHVFARQVEAYGKNGGCLVGISTSGKSLNVIRAFQVAKKMNLSTVAIVGFFQDDLSPFSDHIISVPSKDSSPFIQQIHSVIYHFLCDYIEVNYTT